MSANVDETVNSYYLKTTLGIRCIYLYSAVIPIPLFSSSLLQIRKLDESQSHNVVQQIKDVIELEEDGVRWKRFPLIIHFKDNYSVVHHWQYCSW